MDENEVVNEAPVEEEVVELVNKFKQVPAVQIRIGNVAVFPGVVLDT